MGNEIPVSFLTGRETMSQQWEMLKQTGESFYQQGKFAEAAKYFEEAEQEATRMFGKNHPHYATSLDNLAKVYLRMGEYTKAESFSLQTLEITRRVFGERHPDFATSLNNLGSIYCALGKFAEANPLLEQAAEIARYTMETTNPNLTGILDNLADLYLHLGKYSEAEPLYQQVIEIRHNVLGENHSEYAKSLGGLAQLYSLMGKYSEAEPLFQKYKQNIHKSLGEDHPEFAISLNNLATLYISTGRYAEAKDLLQQSLKINRRVFGESHPNVAEGLNNLGWVHYNLGNYAEAFSLLNQAVEMKRKIHGEHHPDFAVSLNNLAIVCQAMNKYSDAESMYRQVIEIRQEALGNNHPHYAQALHNLASLYHRMGKRETEQLSLQAIEVWRKSLGEDHPEFARGLDKLAGYYYAIGNYAEAEPLYQQVVEIKRKTLGEHHPDFAVTLQNLASLYNSLGKYTQAETLFHQALEINRQTLGEEHPFFAGNLESLAYLYVVADRVEEALPLIDQSFAIQDRIIGQVFSLSSEGQRLAYLESIKRDFYAYLSIIWLHPSISAAQKALNVVLRRKAITTEALAIQRDAVLGGRYPTLVPKLEELRALREQIVQNTLAGPGQEGLLAYQNLVSEWNARKNQLEAELTQQIPEMNLDQQFRQVDRQAISQALPEGTALVEFVYFEVCNFKTADSRQESPWKPARYMAFVLSAGDPDTVQMIDVGEAEPIDMMIAAFRDSIYPNDQQDRNIGTRLKPDRSMLTPDGTILREKIFDLLLPSLKGCKRVFISPEGELTKLPFEILPIENGKRLIDTYNFSYLGAGRDLLRFGRSVSGQPSAPFIIAAPDFDLRISVEDPKQISAIFPVSKPKLTLWDRLFCRRKPIPQTTTRTKSPPVSNQTTPQPLVLSRHSRDFPKTLYFTRLPGMEEEGTRLGKMLQVSPWLGEEATETRLKIHSSPCILHLATHGYFLADQKRDLNKTMQNLGITPGSFSVGQCLEVDLENPLLRSGLALAGANTWIQGGSLPSEAEDGILTAEDVMGLDLLNTELVVLSACETGLGDVKVGEGVFGLRRSFVVAGAKTLVMSLWEVHDLVTIILMERFYQNLLIRGLSRNESLRDAQSYTRDLTIKQLRDPWLSPEMIERLSSGNENYRRELKKWAEQSDTDRPFTAPYYWGAFICQGDPDPFPPTTFVQERTHTSTKHINRHDKAKKELVKGSKTLPIASKKEPSQAYVEALANRIDQAKAVFIAREGQKCSHASGIACVAVSFDGTTIVSNGGVLRGWEKSNGKMVFETKASLAGSCLAISPDNQTLLIGGHPFEKYDTGSVEIIQISDEKTRNFFEGHTMPVFSVAFSPDGKLAASTGMDWMVKIWELSSGKLLAAGRHPDWGKAITFTPNGRGAVSLSWDWTLKVWDLNTRSCITTWEGEPGHYQVALSADSRWAAVGHEEFGNSIIDVTTGQTLERWETGGQIKALYASPKDSLVVWEAHGNLLKGCMYRPNNTYLF
jgi:tetratricopeptide (TPR) repeat protein